MSTIRFVIGLALMAGCTPAPVCAPGASVACVGAGGCSGGQVCNAEGSGFGACECGGETDAGPGDAGLVDGGPVDAGGIAKEDGSSGSPDSGGTDGGDDTVDGGDEPDALVDGGPPITGCDPISHAPCASGQRCAWIYRHGAVTVPGDTYCLPEGTLDEGDACEPPHVTPPYYDDCRRGLTCINRVCTPVCPLSGGGCDATEACITVTGLFDTGVTAEAYGACTPSCDVLTQQLLSGGPCPAGQGCYAVLGTTRNDFVCASVGTVAVGETVTGPYFANTCVPGATAMRRADGSIYCTAWCRPVETHSGAPDGAAGVSPYSCPERGAASPPNECLFSHMVASHDDDPILNTLGVCFDRTGRLYDSNGDMTPDAPWPSCTTLSNTDTNGDGTDDHRYFSCAPPM